MNHTQIRTFTTPLRAACPWALRRWTSGCARGRTSGRRCELIKTISYFVRSYVHSSRLQGAVDAPLGRGRAAGGQGREEAGIRVSDRHVLVFTERLYWENGIRAPFRTRGGGGPTNRSYQDVRRAVARAGKTHRVVSCCKGTGLPTSRNEKMLHLP